MKNSLKSASPLSHLSSFSSSPSTSSRLHLLSTSSTSVPFSSLSSSSTSSSFSPHHLPFRVPSPPSSPSYIIRILLFVVFCCLLLSVTSFVYFHDKLDFSSPPLSKISLAAIFSHHEDKYNYINENPKSISTPTPFSHQHSPSQLEEYNRLIDFQKYENSPSPSSSSSSSSLLSLLHSSPSLPYPSPPLGPFTPHLSTRIPRTNEYQQSSLPLIWEDVDGSCRWNAVAQSTLMDIIIHIQHPPSVLLNSSECSSVPYTFIVQWVSGTFARISQLVDFFSLALHTKRMTILLPRAWRDNGGGKDDYSEEGIISYLSPISACSTHSHITNVIHHQYLSSSLSEFPSNDHIIEDSLSDEWQIVRTSHSKSDIDVMSSSSPSPIYFGPPMRHKNVPSLYTNQSIRNEIFPHESLSIIPLHIDTFDLKRGKAIRDKLFRDFLTSVILLYVFQPSANILILSNVIYNHFIAVGEDKEKESSIEKARQMVQNQKKQMEIKWTKSNDGGWKKIFQKNQNPQRDPTDHLHSLSLSSSSPSFPSPFAFPLCSFYVRRGDKLKEDGFYMDYGYFRNISLFSLTLKQYETSHLTIRQPSDSFSPPFPFPNIYVMTDESRLVERIHYFGRGLGSADPRFLEGPEDFAISVLKDRNILFNPYALQYSHVLITPWSRSGFSSFLSEFVFVSTVSNLLITTLNTHVGRIFKQLMCAKRQLREDFTKCSDVVRGVNDTMEAAQLFTPKGWKPKGKITHKNDNKIDNQNNNNKSPIFNKNQNSDKSKEQPKSIKSPTQSPSPPSPSSSVAKKTAAAASLSPSVSIETFCNSVPFPSSSSLWTPFSSLPNSPSAFSLRTFKTHSSPVVIQSSLSSIEWYERTMKSFPSLTPSSPPLVKAAIVYLISPLEADLQNLKSSLSTLYAKFSKHFPYYPIYLYYNVDEVYDPILFNVSHPQSIRSWIPLSVPLHFYGVSLSPPSSYANVTTGTFYNHKRQGWGYSNMIRFWMVTIWTLPSMGNLEYFLRLDTDSMMRSEYHIDPFVFMKCSQISRTSRQPFHYGYYTVYLEITWAGNKMMQFNYEYAKSNNLLSSLPTHSNWFHWPSDVRKNPKGDSPRVPLFYNNFEIVDLAWWRQQKVQKYITSVDQSNGIYKHRWGDAPLRWMAMYLFSSSHNDSLQINMEYNHPKKRKTRMIPVTMDYNYYIWNTSTTEHRKWETMDGELENA